MARQAVKGRLLNAGVHNGREEKVIGNDIRPEPAGA